MKIINYFKQKYSDAKDIVLLFLLTKKLKRAKKEQNIMIDKVNSLWQ